MRIFFYYPQVLKFKNHPHTHINVLYRQTTKKTYCNVHNLYYFFGIFGTQTKYTPVIYIKVLRIYKTHIPIIYIFNPEREFSKYTTQYTFVLTFSFVYHICNIINASAFNVNMRIFGISPIKPTGVHASTRVYTQTHIYTYI